MDLRRSMFADTVLAGGSTLFKGKNRCGCIFCFHLSTFIFRFFVIDNQLGFGERLLSEVRKAAPRDTKIQIWAPPGRLYALLSYIHPSIHPSLLYHLE
jgi:centractin